MHSNDNMSYFNNMTYFLQKGNIALSIGRKSSQTDSGVLLQQELVTYYHQDNMMSYHIEFFKKSAEEELKEQVSRKCAIQIVASC